jgi:hypothetical protein
MEKRKNETQHNGKKKNDRQHNGKKKTWQTTQW